MISFSETVFGSGYFHATDCPPAAQFCLSHCLKCSFELVHTAAESCLTVSPTPPFQQAVIHLLMNVHVMSQFFSSFTLSFTPFFPLVKARIKNVYHLGKTGINKYFSLLYICFKLLILFVYLHWDEFHLSTNNRRTLCSCLLTGSIVLYSVVS